MSGHSKLMLCIVNQMQKRFAFAYKWFESKVKMFPPHTVHGNKRLCLHMFLGLLPRAGGADGDQSKGFRARRRSDVQEATEASSRKGEARREDAETIKSRDHWSRQQEVAWGCSSGSARPNEIGQLCCLESQGEWVLTEGDQARLGRT